MRFLSSCLLAYVLGTFLSTEWKLSFAVADLRRLQRKKKQKEIILGKLNKGPQTALTLCVKFYFKILWPGGPLLDHLTNHWKQRVPLKTTNHMLLCLSALSPLKTFQSDIWYVDSAVPEGNVDGKLSSPSTASFQAFSVNAFRWRIRDERPGDKNSLPPRDPKRIGCA